MRECRGVCARRTGSDPNLISSFQLSNYCDWFSLLWQQDRCRDPTTTTHRTSSSSRERPEDVRGKTFLCLHKVVEIGTSPSVSRFTGVYPFPLHSSLDPSDSVPSLYWTWTLFRSTVADPVRSPRGRGVKDLFTPT